MRGRLISVRNPVVRALIANPRRGARRHPSITEIEARKELRRIRDEILQSIEERNK